MQITDPDVMERAGAAMRRLDETLRADETVPYLLGATRDTLQAAFDSLREMHQELQRWDTRAEHAKSHLGTAVDYLNRSWG